jgi:hypothetical protein
MFVDDGAGRPGCGVNFDDDDFGTEAGCFSRAVMYSLNDETEEVSARAR